MICIGLLTTPRAIQGPTVDEFHKAFNHHVAKAGFAHFVLAIGAEQMPASWEQMLQEVAEAARPTHLMKMRGLYVDYTDNGTLLEPNDVGEDAARFMVAPVTRLLEQSAPAEAAVTEDPNAYLQFVREWQDGIDYVSLQARVDEDPMAFLAEARGFARDELPPSAALLGALGPKGRGRQPERAAGGRAGAARSRLTGAGGNEGRSSVGEASAGCSPRAVSDGSPAAGLQRHQALRAIGHAGLRVRGRAWQPIRRRSSRRTGCVLSRS